MDKEVYTNKLRNQINNANVAKTAINMAEKSGNVKVRTAAKALNAADKVTGGKVSKSLNNKIAKNPVMSSMAKVGGLASNLFNSKEKTQESYSNDEPTEIDYNASLKKPLIIIGAFALVGFLTVAIVSVLLTSIFYIVPIFDVLDDANNSLDFDNLSDEAIDRMIDEKNAEKKIDKYVGISDTFEDDYVIEFNYDDKTDLKLVSSEEDEYIEKMIERYSSSISKIENYNEKIAYRFFSKLYYIEKYYAEHYGVSLDMPLLMATLNVQSDDLGEVFSSNVVWYERYLKDNNSNYSYTKNWSHYISTKYDSSHDIELLCQHMVSNSVKESCVNSAGNETKSEVTPDYKEATITCEEGETYKTVSMGYQIDREKYKEFLYLFLETKYYSETKDKKFDWDQDKGPSSGNSEGNSTENNESSSSSNEHASAMIRLAKNELTNNGGANGGLKYRKAYGIGNSAWCAIFVWYISANTSVNGVSIYPDIVNHKTNSTGSYMRWFVDNQSSNIKFYYNDSCSYYKDKNGVGYKYTPKPGDYVFFDWSPGKAWTYSNNVQDHIGIVEYYSDGKLTTIEGNINNNLREINRGSLNNCEIIGFGSWY